MANLVTFYYVHKSRGAAFGWCQKEAEMMGWVGRMLAAGVAVSLVCVCGEGASALAVRRTVMPPGLRHQFPAVDRDRVQSDKGKDDKGKGDQGKGDQGKDDKGKDDKGKGDQGKGDKGKDDQGKDDKGKGDQTTDEDVVVGDDSTAPATGDTPAETDSTKLWSTKLWSTKLWSAKLWSVTETTRAKAKAAREQGETGRYLVFVDGERTNLAPIEQGGRTLAPIGDVAGVLGAGVSWEQNGQRVTVTRGETTIIFTVGAAQAVVNGWQVDLPAPIETKNDRVYGPLRFVAEVLDAHVDYDGETDSIVVVTPPSEAEMLLASGDQSAP